MDTSPFNNLSAELRNLVWEFTVTNTNSDAVNLSEEQPAITRTCKQIRNECISMYYARNEFKIDAIQEDRWHEFDAKISIRKTTNLLQHTEKYHCLIPRLHLRIRFYSDWWKDWWRQRREYYWELMRALVNFKESAVRPTLWIRFYEPDMNLDFEGMIRTLEEVGLPVREIYDRETEELLFKHEKLEKYSFV